MKSLRILLTCLTVTPLIPLWAQVGRNRNASDPPVFQSTTQLVIETVSVRDRNGNAVDGLTAQDFVVTEDGHPQAIRFFEYQKLDRTLPAEVLPSTIRPAALPRLNRSQIAPAQPGDLRYRDRRLLALYFDFTSMPLPDQHRALTAATRFVRTQMTAADLLALMAFRSGAVEVFQDFTADRERLLEILETLIIGEDESAPIEASTRADSGAAFGQNDAEFNVFFTDRQLAALQMAATMLGRLNEKKSLVYFASGLRLNGTNNQAQLSATINAAIRAGVSFWPVDARGLLAQAPMGDATTGSPGGEATYTGGTANAFSGALQRSQDTLWTLAADTGGKALLDSNDLARGIVEAQNAVSSYYVLGYYTTNANPDGKFRKVNVTLAAGAAGRDLDIEYRRGYYAPKVFSKFTSADRERQLEDALMLADPVTELTIAMEIGYFQLNRAEYFVPVMVKIPGSELAYARRRGAERTVIDFVAEIKDEYGSTITNTRDRIDIKLSGETVAELARRPIEYDAGFTLLPGRYRIKLLARDGETGRMGTYELPFHIPNLNREAARIPISSVVLSSRRADLRDALYNAGRDKGRQAQLASPLVQDGFKLIPSVTRVFSRAKEMYVYLQAYQQEVESANPLLAFVTFYRNGQKAFETVPLEATEAEANRLKTMPLRFTFPLDKLETGEYLCQVTVLDPRTRKTNFWQSSLLLIP